MANNAPREALAAQSHSDLAALVADAWSDRGWAVAGGDPEGADVVATREGAYAERLAIVVAEPGTPIDAHVVQRAAAIREQERADVVMVVGTDDVQDGASKLAGRESLNVKVLDGWSLCRVLEEQGLLERVEGGGGAMGDSGVDQRIAGASDPGDGPGTAAGQDGPDAAREAASTASDSAASGAQTGGEGREETGEDGNETTPSAADNETPCPECGEPIFRPLIEQGLQCPYCDTDFD